MLRKFHRLRSWCAVGGLLAATTTMVTTAAVAEPALARGSETARSKLTVKVAPGKWGDVDVRDVQKFVDAVADEFRSIVADLPEGRLNIRVVPRGGSPRVLYDRGPDGEYVVQLTARNEAWFQYAYQFSHELCHIFSHFDHKERQGDGVATGNQWFEESLCETASLFTLKRLALTWTAEPPDRRWLGYGPTLAAYADFLLAQKHRQLPTTQSFEQWYRENQSSLRENPYLREKNELVATALLPLFEQDPARWQAIAHLNADRSSADKEFADFLADWYIACPAENREVVRRTMALFGYNAPAVPISRHAASLIAKSPE